MAKVLLSGATKICPLACNRSAADAPPELEPISLVAKRTSKSMTLGHHHQTAHARESQTNT
ncbi:hypothetical protein RRF57_004442 [Xylaria bambusicola]|uniref:Uncharacterized protein n=1 Tax=Xylaria bambusicola TaxID=326684 RepID=A0AAN7Z3V3_9PEZI